jgi:hypothetical protein
MAPIPGGSYKNNSFKLTSLEPASDLTSVTVTTVSPTPAVFVHHVTATAVCVDPVPGLQLVTATSPTNGLDKVVSVACPAGTQVHGLGGGLIGAGGRVHIARLDSWGQSGTSAVTLEARNSTSSPLVSNWTARVHAICAF